MLRAMMCCVLAVAFFCAMPAFAGPPCVDVNKATASDLQKSLKGVGPKLAKAIVANRAAHRAKATKAGKKTWNYLNWAQLLKVPGVGPKVCAANVGKVCFSGKIQKACPKPPAKKK